MIEIEYLSNKKLIYIFVKVDFVKKHILILLVFSINALSLQAMHLSSRLYPSRNKTRRNFFDIFGKKDKLKLQKQLTDLKAEMTSFKEEQLRKERENKHHFTECLNVCNDVYSAVENIRNNIQQGLPLHYADINRFANSEAKARRCYGLKYNPINKPFDDGTTILGHCLCRAMDEYMNSYKSLYEYEKNFCDEYITELNTGYIATLVRYGARINDIDRKKLDGLLRLSVSAKQLDTICPSKIGHAQNTLNSFQYSSHPME